MQIIECKVHCNWGIGYSNPNAIFGITTGRWAAMIDKDALCIDASGAKNVGCYQKSMEIHMPFVFPFF
jgi:hypothetical protein